MRSSAWDSSAFLLTYDDWGGWYDHVVPPQVDEFGYGPRVPALLVSPFAKTGYIDSTELDFTSILKFIETNWGVDPLWQTRDAKANTFQNAFDFTQKPREPQFLPLTREVIPPAISSPAKVIYSTYGLGILLAIGTIGFASLRSAKPGKLSKKGS